jgi:hypothetical protein
LHFLYTYTKMNSLKKGISRQAAKLFE